MKTSAPIGIFDSGIGGLTVASAIQQAFPQESIIYFGDTAHLPYGEKSAEAIQGYALQITDFLIKKGCKMIVIACNSASATAYQLLYERYGQQLPIIDVISPLVELIANKNYRKVGVIATKATIRSDIYAQQLHQKQTNLEIASLATSLLATMIEEGFVNNEVSQAVLHKYLRYPDFEDIEALLLACTHYPLIRPEIEAFYQGRVAVYDSVDAVVQRIAQNLQLLNLQQTNNTDIDTYQHFYVSDYTPSFEQATRIFYKKEVLLQEHKFYNG